MRKIKRVINSHDRQGNLYTVAYIVICAITMLIHLILIFKMNLVSKWMGRSTDLVVWINKFDDMIFGAPKSHLAIYNGFDGAGLQAYKGDNQPFV